MPSFPKPFGPRRVVVGALALMGLSTAAWAFPWDIDMVDALYKKAYGWKMMTPPEGAVSRNRFSQNHDRTTPEGAALVNPLQSSPETLKQGERMFTVYCAVCHGAQGLGGAEVMRNEPDVGIRRFPVPAPRLSGDAAVSTGRSDGYIYLTIRNGAAIMPGYGQAMSDEEMWSIVSYIRTLDGAQYVPPAPAGEGI